MSNNMSDAMKRRFVVHKMVTKSREEEEATSDHDNEKDMNNNASEEPEVVAVDYDGSVEGVAAACRQAGVQFITIRGIDQLMPTLVANLVKKETLESAEMSLSAKDFEFLKDWQANEDESPNPEIKDLVCEFFKACKEDDINSARKLIEEKGINVHKPLLKDLGQCPIHIASRYGAKTITAFLVKEKKVDVNVTSFSGKTPLHYCVGNGFEDKWIETCKILIDAGVKTDVRDNANRLPVQTIIPSESPSDTEIHPFLQDIIRKLYPLLKDQFDEHAHSCIKELITQLNKKHCKDPTPSQQQQQQQQEEETCAICYENPPDTMVLPCEHNIVCKSCSKELRGTPNADKCVYCRQEITHILE